MVVQLVFSLSVGVVVECLHQEADLSKPSGFLCEGAYSTAVKCLNFQQTGVEIGRFAWELRGVSTVEAGLLCYSTRATPGNPLRTLEIRGQIGLSVL